jgi:hypothetical protein
MQRIILKVRLVFALVLVYAAVARAQSRDTPFRDNAICQAL